jgi:hypothetical protein
MPSPFPGMDPYLEGYEWESFHAAFMVDLADALSPRLPEQYVVRPQRRVYVEHTFSSDPEVETIIADGVILRPPQNGSSGAVATLPEVGTATGVEVVLPMPVTHYETYLTVRELETMEVVTVIELLSPTNKRGGDGRRAYLEKREEVLKSRTNLVELDLLRGGRRLPTVTPLPPGDYFAIISRMGRRPMATVIPWTLRDRLPTISVPLRREDADVPLDLQAAFTQRYDRGGYRRSSMYRMALDPSLLPEDREWAAQLVQPAS